MADYDIKMDGEEASFKGGATRYTKTGKGRYDLIPERVVVDVLNHAWDNYYREGDMTTSEMDLIQGAYTQGKSRYYDTIINIVNMAFVVHDTACDIGTDGNGIRCFKTTFCQFLKGFKAMLKALAIHYEKGAEKYGVDNWKKGIPVIGGDRGGSFTDSMLRHLNQYLMDETDEPHHVSAVWNAFGALYMLDLPVNDD